MKRTKKCKYCQTEIDSKAKVCPNCKRNLNSHGCLVGIIAAIFVVGFVIVVGTALKKTSELPGTSKQNNVSGLKAEPSASEDTQKTHSTGDTVTIDTWEITLNSVEVLEQIDNTYGYFSPEDGSKYVVANVTVKNTGTQSETFLPAIYLGDDVKAKITYLDYEFSSSQLLGYQDDLHSATLNPLSSKTGIIAFEIADEAVSANDLVLTLFNNSENITYSLSQ